MEYNTPLALPFRIGFFDNLSLSKKLSLSNSKIQILSLVKDLTESKLMGVFL
jgi:hypothetical protein